jgi:FKBP-type peptidyl-prolyl cis-trans isomerase (trigger factor)
VEVDWRELRQRQEEPARKSVHARLLLDALARTEALTVERREVEARLREDAGRAGEDYDKLRAVMEQRGGFETLRTQMVREKALDYLVSVANIQGGE